MDEQTLALITDLHIRSPRQGPGSLVALVRAMDLAGISTDAHLTIADIGCGTGASAIPLLERTRATVTAVDLRPEFLEELVRRARAAGVHDKLTPLAADMGDLPFSPDQFDVIWSEGAVYSIGFAHGTKLWHSYLKPGGMLVVSEVIWLRPDVPEPLRAFWDAAYPEIGRASEKMRVLEDNGYTLMGYFVLPPAYWLDNYYTPLAAGFEDFLDRHNHSESAQALVNESKEEIALYEQYQDFFSYAFYIAKKR